MKFDFDHNILFSDTTIPDAFFSNYLLMMPADQVKLYMYIFFLASKNKTTKKADLCAKMDYALNEVDSMLNQLEGMGLIHQENGRLKLVDIKEKELYKLYRPKYTSSAEESVQNMEKNKMRNQVVKAINNKFFSGLMGSDWFTDIDMWFERFLFEEDVMQSLFQYCYNLKKLHRNYVLKVAQTWNQNGVKTGVQLENYLHERDHLKGVCKQVASKLRRYSPFTENEEEIIFKWVQEYHYDFVIIEMALKKAVNRSNVGLSYFDAILKEWHNKGLRTKDEVAKYETQLKESAPKRKKAQQPANAQRGSFDERGYDEEYLESLYDND